MEFKGTVVNLRKKEKGYFGFIKYAPDKPNMYFNQKSVAPGQRITEGSTVTFSIKHLPNGQTCAQNVTLAEGRKLPRETQQAVEVALSVLLEERGVVDCVHVSGKLKELGVAWEDYAGDLERFVENCLSGIFAVRRNLRLDGRLCPSALVWSVSQGIPPEALDAVQAALERELREAGFCALEEFERILAEAGVESYKIHAQTPEEFAAMFLSGCKVVRNVTIEGRTLECALVAGSQEEPAGEGEGERPGELAVLDRLYAQGQYADFLRSPLLERTAPCDLPIAYLEMALTCARRLLYPQREDAVKLNLFHRELISCVTTGDFFRKWKKTDGFDARILIPCAQSALAEFEPERDVGMVCKLLNLLGTTYTLNSSYAGIAKRFAIVENELVPCMFVVRAFTQRSPSNVQRCLAEYCQLVKDLKTSSSRKYVRDEDRLYSFPQVFTVLKDYLHQDAAIPQNLQTMVVSTFVDTNSMEELTRLIPGFIPDPQANERRLVDLVNGPEGWTEEMFFGLMDNNVSEKLLQKCIVLLWEKYSLDAPLPMQFLRVLSWVVRHDGVVCIDELMRYQYTTGYNKTAKQVMLLESFGSIRDAAWEEPGLYALAAYVALFVRPDVPESYITQAARESLDDWEKFSAGFYGRVTEPFREVREENAEDFAALFRIFRLDGQHYPQLQDRYADWFTAKLWSGECAVTETERALDLAYRQEAWEAYVRVYMAAVSELGCLAEPQRRLEEYTSAMLNLRNFTELIAFALHDKQLDKQQRTELLTRVLGENFRFNGLGPKAFTIFGEGFTCQDAIAMLLEAFHPTKLGAITSLVGLYTHSGELCKADYLYQIYRHKTESGFFRFYSQYRGCSGRYLSKAHNHYDTIKLAFECLAPEALVEFLQWTRSIPVPEFKAYNPSHVFSFYYDTIRRDPKNGESWKNFWRQLIQHVDRNAWSICVCEGVMKDVLGIGGYSNSRVAIRNMLNRRDGEPLPCNFLPYAFSGLIGSQDRDLVGALANLLEDEEAYRRLISENPWYPSYSDSVKRFKSFCLEQYEQTADAIYYSLLTGLGMALDRQDMQALSQTGADKQYLFTQICRNFLSGTDRAEMIQLLFNGEWKQLSNADAQMLELLRLLYSEDETLLTEQSLLFPDEESVARFKQDCARILLHYPQKTGLHSFDADCTNLPHKYVVFGYVFRVFYDEDIYDSYVPRYSDFGSRREFVAYLEFLRSAYIEQLEKNVSFDFFYRKWRYLKLYINGVLREGVGSDDGYILDIMESYGHTELIFQSDYLPFREGVRAFAGLECLSVEAKECYLFGLMVGHTEECLSLYGGELLAMPAEARIICRELTDKLDYRETTCSIYRLYLDSIRERDFGLVLSVAGIVSDSAWDALNALRQVEDFNRGFKLFCDVGLAHKPSEAVNKVLRMSDDQFFRFEDMLVPLICSRQFRFHIYGRLRGSLLLRGKDIGTAKFERITGYLEEKGFEEAANVRHYLHALYGALNGDAQAVREVVARYDIEKGVPAQWHQEAERLRQYAAGVSDRFSPDRSVMDNSQGGKRQSENFGFVGRLQSVLGAERRNLDGEAAAELYEKFRAMKGNPWEKARLGMTLLCSYPKLEKDSPFRELLPAREKLALEVGLELTGTGVNLSVDQQLGVAAELFAARRSYTGGRWAELAGRLGEQINYLLRRFLSLQTWVRYGEIIQEYLLENRNAQDFRELRGRILEPCAAVFQPEYPLEQRYDTLTELSMSFQGLESVYARNVLEAIHRELRRLEEGIRLRIDLVNEADAVTDGCAYFRIRNVGRRTVSLAGEEISILCKAGNQPESPVELRNICDLRSGFVTGGKRRLNMPEDEEQTEVTFSVVINGKAGERTVICRTSGTLRRASCGAALQIGDSTRYAVTYAVPGSEKLYGRDGVKEKLAGCIGAGVTVLYGPSRIGKTSLLNWVHKDLAAKRGNVMTVLYGGEHGMGKQRDYVSNFVDRRQPIPYGDDEKMAEYLLVQTIIQGIRRRQRFTAPAAVPVPGGLLERLVEVLGDEDRYISDRYISANQLLREAGLELWILLDEFQQVVEQWKPEKSCDFVEVCQMLADPSPDSPVNRIKLVVCGSDDLLRHMVLEDDSVWRTAFRTRIAVEPLEKLPFQDMIREEPALYGTNLRYSDSALDALYTYTDGVALYGKEICNSVMADIQRNPGKYECRNIIYISDIAEATQTLLNRQASELDTKAKEGICEIYDAVTKNLDDDTDKQYLWYMAQWLSDNPEHDGFPERIFTGRKLVRGPEKLRESLAIALARGIIKLKPSQYESGNVYAFRTVFYYFAFLGSAKKDLREEKIFAPEEDFADEGVAAAEDPYDYTNLIKVAPNFSRMYTPEQQKAILGAFAATSKEPAQQALKGLMGDSIGTSIGVQNNLQINIQQITDTLAGFSTGTLTGAKLLESVNALPRLNAYYAPDRKLAESDPALEERRMEHGLEAVANAYADGIRPIIDQEDGVESDFDRCHVRELLGLDERQFELLGDVLGDWGYEQLRLTLHLHLMFCQAQSQEQAQIDYSPVAIMYCKLMEAMLKEYHSDGYARVFDEMPTNVSVRDRKTGKYSYLSYYDLMMGRHQHRVTIGTFTYPLRDGEKRRLLGEYFVNKWKEPTTALWEKHGRAAEEILQIRNQSAHGQKDHRVTKEQQETLIGLLFTDGGGELLRIRDLVRYTRS